MPRKRGAKDLERSRKFNENKRLRLEAEAKRLEDEAAAADASNDALNNAPDMSTGTWDIDAGAPIFDTSNSGMNDAPNISNESFDIDDGAFIFNAGDLEPQQDQFVFDEAHQQASQRSPSSPGGLDSQRKTSVEGNNSTTRNPTALVPATGQDLSPTDSLATPPVRPLGSQHSAECIDLTGEADQDLDDEPDPTRLVICPSEDAGYIQPPVPEGCPSEHDYYLSIDKVHAENRLPPLAQCNNDMVERIYGRCSEQHHHLLVLQHAKWRHKVMPVLNGEQEIPKPGVPECRGSRSVRMREILETKCPLCHQRIGVTTQSRARFVAILNEHPDNYWKAVVTRPGMHRYVYEASHICNELSTCSRWEHILFETYQWNTVRKGHHASKRKCWCPIRCIMPKPKI